MARCVFCGSSVDPVTVEHVIAKWARRAFDIQGPVTVDVRELGEDSHRRLGAMQHLNVTVDGLICEGCNTGWMSGMEKAVAPVLKPMAVSAKPATLTPEAQARLAAWAVKPVLLIELAIRQHYPGQRLAEGYRVSEAELAWLWRERTPPPRSLVWLGCWDCQQATPVRFEPSGAPLPTADGVPVTGHFTTFTLGYVAFQVFTVDFITAEQHGARLWNLHAPESLADALVRIWPPLPRAQEISWPPAAFRREDWQRLVTWDGKLRPTAQQADR